MSQTVICLGCDTEWEDPTARQGQKYPLKCLGCGRTNLENQRLSKKWARRADQRALHRAISQWEHMPTAKLQVRLREYEAAFEAEGGRGVDLAEGIDSMRLALSARRDA